MTSPLSPKTINLDGYGHPPLRWERVHDLLAATVFFGRPAFLGTVSPSGRPWAAAVAALWYEGAIFFTSAPHTRKSRNLAANPQCTLSASLATVDIVCSGRASRVTDPKLLEILSARCRSAGWPVQVQDLAFTAPYAAPSAGPPPWHLYRIALRTVTGNATADPPGATRWEF